jgi:hypothetical protein
LPSGPQSLRDGSFHQRISEELGDESLRSVCQRRKRSELFLELSLILDGTILQRFETAALGGSADSFFLARG